jgi:hypothetical protein
MGYFIGLSNLKPSGRTDGRKWTSVGFYEAPPGVDGQPGAWTEIDAQALPDYSNAAVTPVFSLSTTEATAPSGLWYKVQFRDSFTGIQESVPEYSGTSGVPDVEWIRETSNADWGEMDYPAPEAGGVDRLQSVLDEAVVTFYSITGLNPRTFPETDKRLALVRQALRMLVEYQAASTTMEHLGTASDFDMLSGMSASDYSETRRGMHAGSGVLHPWPALNRLLNAILYFDSQGNPVQEGPSVSRELRPRPYEEVMKSLLAQHPGAIRDNQPLWPQPWVTNTNGTA